MARSSKQHLSIDGRNVPVSSLDKVLFFRGRVKKAQVIDYYLRISKYLLPHLRNRPVTLKRYPNGAVGEFFYEKDAPSFTPDWVKTFPVPRRGSSGSIRYILINDRATLAWLANLANLEIHPFLHRVPQIDRPTMIVFDLDPGEGANVLTCGRVAFLLRDLLRDADLYFLMDAAFERVEELGDLFEPVLSLKQELPSSVLKYLTAKRPRSLARYETKRDFGKTAEPAPAHAGRSRQGSRRRFVVQKHAASHLHYDFRLEMHDVLKSWAVPKGPPYAEGEKRLAMPTEDHPLEYLEFEGIIPKGQYGGGTVMVWDIGTYELIEGNYYKGYLRIHLNGRKLKGEWELVRQPGERDRDTWQLVKSGASLRAISKKRDDTSALSRRSMQEIANKADVTWQSNLRKPSVLTRSS